MSSGPSELATVRAATFTGHDPDNLVTAIVDGEAMVVRISFAGTVGTRRPEVVEAAVRTAVDAARAAMVQAWQALNPEAGLGGEGQDG